MAAQKWHDGFYVQVYQLACDGNSKSAIARILGVNAGAFSRWMKNRPYLKKAYLAGKKKRDKTGDGKDSNEAFHHYVFQRLPPELKKLWKKIHRVQEERNGVQRMEALLEGAGKYARMHLFLYALSARNFNVSSACRAVNISVRTFKSWCLTEPGFQEMIDEMEFHKKNFYEAALDRLVRRGETQAVIFANKTFNKDRGYSEKQDVNIQHNITHSMVDMDAVMERLPLEVRKQILAVIREMRPKAIEHKPAAAEDNSNAIEGEFELVPAEKEEEDA